jgi:hypothetical protein
LIVDRCRSKAGCDRGIVVAVVVLFVGEESTTTTKDEHDWKTPIRPIADTFLPTPIRFPRRRAEKRER